MRCTVELVAGELRASGESVQVVYAGRRRNYAYLIRTVFKSCHTVEARRCWLFTCARHVRLLAQRADVTLLDIGWPYHGSILRHGGYLEVPDWLNLVVELGDTWERTVAAFRGTTRNNDLRLIRRNGYRFDAIRSPRAVRDFYERMYLPFARHRHEGSTAMAPLAHVLRQARKGWLLRVFRDTEIVSAGVIYREGDVLYFLWMGVPADQVASPAEAAISALYYFGFRHAFDEGCRVVDFTGTRAFLGDGAYRYKRKWGVVVEDAFSPSSILIRPRTGSARAVAFCRDLPVVARSGDLLEAVFVITDAGDADAAFARFNREYLCRGIDRLTIIALTTKNETSSVAPGPADCQYQLIRCPFERFADTYTGRSTATE